MTTGDTKSEVLPDGPQGRGEVDGKSNVPSRSLYARLELFILHMRGHELGLSRRLGVCYDLCGAPTNAVKLGKRST